MRTTDLPFSLSAKERLNLVLVWDLFRPEVQQCKTLFVWGPPPALPPLMVSEKKQIFLRGENTCRGGSMLWTTRMQKHFHPLPYSCEKGISGLTQLLSCPFPPGAGTPCSVCSPVSLLGSCFLCCACAVIH